MALKQVTIEGEGPPEDRLSVDAKSIARELHLLEARVRFLIAAFLSEGRTGAAGKARDVEMSLVCAQAELIRAAEMKRGPTKAPATDSQPSGSPQKAGEPKTTEKPG